MTIFTQPPRWQAAIVKAVGANLTNTGGTLDASVVGKPRFEVSGLPSLSPVVGTALKMPFTTVVTDPNGYWDAVNFRWLPLVAGWYSIDLTLQFSAASSTVYGAFQAQIRKNGTSVNGFISQASLIAQSMSRSVANSLITNFNGSTDYLEAFAIYVTPISGSWTTPSFISPGNNIFSAFYLGN